MSGHAVFGEGQGLEARACIDVFGLGVRHGVLVCSFSLGSWWPLIGSEFSGLIG